MFVGIFFVKLVADLERFLIVRMCYMFRIKKVNQFISDIYLFEYSYKLHKTY